MQEVNRDVVNINATINREKVIVLEIDALETVWQKRKLRVRFR